MSPDTPDAPMMEPHPSPPNCPDEMDPGTMVYHPLYPWQRDGDWMPPNNPPGDDPNG